MPSGLFSQNLFSAKPSSGKGGGGNPLSSILSGMMGGGINPMAMVSALSGLSGGGGANPLGGLAGMMGGGAANPLGGLAGMMGGGGANPLGGLAGMMGGGAANPLAGIDPAMLLSLLGKVGGMAAAAPPAPPVAEEENIRDAAFVPVPDDGGEGPADGFAAANETAQEQPHAQGGQTAGSGGQSSGAPFWQNLDPAMIASLAQLFMKSGLAGGNSGNAAQQPQTAPPMSGQPATDAAAAAGAFGAAAYAPEYAAAEEEQYPPYDPCVDCLCACPRASMRLPQYEEVRGMAATWRRY